MPARFERQPRLVSKMGVKVVTTLETRFSAG